MVSSLLLSAMAAASLVSSVAAADKIVSIATPTASVAPAAMTSIGCFNTGQPLEDHGFYKFQSTGNCQRICAMLEKPVMGLVDGTDCWCGDLFPPKSQQTKNDSCDTPCKGYPDDKCGGPKKYSILLSGITDNRIEYYDGPLSSSSSSGAAASSTSAKQEAPQTVVISASNAATSTPPPSSNNGPNKAGIAAGVVVGVVALAAIIGGVLFYLRQKKRRAVEEEYRRQAAVNSFVGGKLHTSNSSMTDSRLDPEFMHRRASNGSIADNEDYSRRILKVTNPDGN